MFWGALSITCQITGGGRGPKVQTGGELYTTNIKTLFPFILIVNINKHLVHKMNTQRKLSWQWYTLYFTLTVPCRTLFLWEFIFTDIWPIHQKMRLLQKWVPAKLFSAKTNFIKTTHKHISCNTVHVYESLRQNKQNKTWNYLRDVLPCICCGTSFVLHILHRMLLKGNQQRHLFRRATQNQFTRHEVCFLCVFDLELLWILMHIRREL